MKQLADFEFVQLTQDTPLLPFVSEDEDSASAIYIIGK